VSLTAAPIQKSETNSSCLPIHRSRERCISFQNIESFKSGEPQLADIAAYYRDSVFPRGHLTSGENQKFVQGGICIRQFLSVMEFAPALDAFLHPKKKPSANV